jgi:eukaryotic-like serine/threonine-protein kinase
MTPTQWEEVKQRFHEALQHPAESRKSFLARACSDDIVRAEVERLLTEGDRAGDFLSRPGARDLIGLLALESRATTPSLNRAKMTPGQTLDRYQILSLLGSGGMGMVYRAHDPLLQRSIAVKLLLDEFSADETALKRFRSEAHALSALSHPNICTVHDIGEVEGRTFIVMEYVPGTRLDELIRRKTMPANEAVRYAIQIAAGLAKAHTAGIIHRDLKPGNIMVTDDGQIKLLDFGVAKLTPAVDGLARNESMLTIEGTIVGTAAYMSPEQAEAKGVDARSDIFSFGAVLFEMLTGQRAFQGGSHIGTLSAILSVNPKPVSSICPGIPVELDTIVARCLCKNPDQRFQNAAAVVAALQEIQATMEAGARRRGPVHARLIRRMSRVRAIVAAVLALLLIAAGWAAIGLRGRNQKRIAVLPFNILGNDQGQEVQALADGVVETLTSKLSQIEEFQGILMVVPVDEIRSRKIANAEAARRISGCNLVITGSGQRWGDQIQFTLNLVDTATIRQIASRTFEFDASKPITLRDEAVNGAVELLELKLTPKVRELIQVGETSTPGANTEYLKGIGFLARYDLTGNLDRAIQSLTEATRLDPRYAQAFAALGHAHWLKAQTKNDPGEKELALEGIQESIRLDPNLAEGHLRLGQIYDKNQRRAEAIQEVRTALSITPGNLEAYGILGDIYVSAKQYDLAEAAYREAVRRKPDDWFAHLQFGLFYMERNQGTLARKQYEEGLKITPDNEVLHRNLADVDVLEGNFRKASDDLVNSLRFEKNVRSYSLLGVTYYYQRRYTEAVDALKSGLELDPNHYTALGNLGIVYQHLPGHEQMAREELQKAIKGGEQALEVTKSEARIHANLAEYWARLGDRQKALAQIGLISKVSRDDLADQLILVYELTGNRRLALQTLQELPPNHYLLPDIRSDPDLVDLWREPALRQLR